MISCIPLCGSFLNGAIVPSVYDKTKSFGSAFQVGFLFCIAGLIIVIILVVLDYKTDKHDQALLQTFILEKKKKEKEWRKANNKKVGFAESVDDNATETRTFK